MTTAHADLVVPDAPDLLTLDTLLTEGFDLALLTAARSLDPATKALQVMVERADARARKGTAFTVQERFEGFARLRFRPYGLYLPDDPGYRQALQQRQRLYGGYAQQDDRLKAYYALQDETEQLCRDGVPGVWTGQQAIARSETRFRIVAFSRRAGKTIYAAMEAMAIAILRPCSWIWITAPTLRLVTRCFEMVRELVAALGLPTLINRNTKDERLVQLENGSKFEGISLDDEESAAGASVDFAIVDEAKRLPKTAWTRGVLPPLSDKAGGALVLSSFRGTTNFFAEKVSDAKTGKDVAWEAFTGPSWQNFFVFPEGRESPVIQQAMREMAPREFLEEFGGVAIANEKLIIPEFRERVHLGDVPFTPGYPVVLMVDPSSGAQEYACLAIQDFGDQCHVLDEFYIAGALAEDAIAWAQRQPWNDMVKDIQIDNNAPDEGERWAKAGYPAMCLEHKPHPNETYPIVRRLFRDPVRFFRFYEQRLDEILVGAGVTRLQFDDMVPEEQAPYVLEIEETLADTQLTAQWSAALRACSHIQIDRRCIHLADELLHYQYRKVRSGGTDVYTEEPLKKRDHLADCLRYFCWVFKRWEYEQHQARVAELVVQQSPRGFYAALTPGMQRQYEQARQERPEYLPRRTLIANALRAQVLPQVHTGQPLGRWR